MNGVKGGVSKTNDDTRYILDIFNVFKQGFDMYSTDTDPAQPLITADTESPVDSLYGLYDRYDTYDVCDLCDVCDLYDPYDLYDMHDLHDLHYLHYLDYLFKV